MQGSDRKNSSLMAAAKGKNTDAHNTWTDSAGRGGRERANQTRNGCQGPEVYPTISWRINLCMMRHISNLTRTLTIQPSNSSFLSITNTMFTGHSTPRHINTETLPSCWHSITTVFHSPSRHLIIQTPSSTWLILYPISVFHTPDLISVSNKTQIQGAWRGACADVWS